jgi:hypothetical protein
MLDVIAFIAICSVSLLFLSMVRQIIDTQIAVVQTKKKIEEEGIKSDLPDMAFATDSRVLKLYKFSEYYYEEHKKYAYITNGKFGYAIFNDFRIMFDKSDLINKFNLMSIRKPNELNLYSQKDFYSLSRNIFSFQGEIKFDDVYMVFEDKKDWDLAQK